MLPQSRDDLIVAVNVSGTTEQGCLMPKCLPQKFWQFRDVSERCQSLPSVLGLHIIIKRNGWTRDLQRQEDEADARFTAGFKDFNDFVATHYPGVLAGRQSPLAAEGSLEIVTVDSRRQSLFRFP
jgi:hypothetical protein